MVNFIVFREFTFAFPNIRKNSAEILAFRLKIVYETKDWGSHTRDKVTIDNTDNEFKRLCRGKNGNKLLFAYWNLVVGCSKINDQSEFPTLLISVATAKVPKANAKCDTNMLELKVNLCTIRFECDFVWAPFYTFMDMARQLNCIQYIAVLQSIFSHTLTACRRVSFKSDRLNRFKYGKWYRFSHIIQFERTIHKPCFWKV